VSREINPWKSFDLLRGSDLWLLAPSAEYLTARPPELTIVCRYVVTVSSCQCHNNLAGIVMFTRIVQLILCFLNIGLILAYIYIHTHTRTHAHTHTRIYIYIYISEWPFDIGLKLHNHQNNIRTINRYCLLYEDAHCWGRSQLKLYRFRASDVYGRQIFRINWQQISSTMYFWICRISFCFRHWSILYRKVFYYWPGVIRVINGWLIRWFWGQHVPHLK